MYKKCGAALLWFLCMLVTAQFCVKGIEIEKYAAENIFSATSFEVAEQELSYEKNVSGVQTSRAEAELPVLQLNSLEKCGDYNLNRSDYEILLKIVEAEAGTEDQKGKLLVANVVLNRLENIAFPDTIAEVVYQQENGVFQFSPVENGRIDDVTVSQETYEAVEMALEGHDVSEGALYFAARSAAAPDKMCWFDQKLEKLFSYGGHEFFR